MGIFHEINHPAIGIPPWLWKPPLRLLTLQLVDLVADPWSSCHKHQAERVSEKSTRTPRKNPRTPSVRQTSDGTSVQLRSWIKCKWVCLKHWNNGGTCWLTSPLCFFPLQSFRQTKVKSNANLLEEASASTIQSIHFSIQYPCSQWNTPPIKHLVQCVRWHNRCAFRQTPNIPTSCWSGSVSQMFASSPVRCTLFAELLHRQESVWCYTNLLNLKRQLDAFGIVHLSLFTFFSSRNGITCQKSSHRKNLASLIIHNTIIIKWRFPKWGLPL